MDKNTATADLERRRLLRAMLADASAWEFATFERAESAPPGVARLFDLQPV